MGNLKAENDKGYDITSSGKPQKIKSNAERQQRYKATHKTTQVDLPEPVVVKAKALKATWGLSSAAKAIDKALDIASAPDENDCDYQETMVYTYAIIANDCVALANDLVSSIMQIVLNKPLVGTLGVANACAQHIASQIFNDFAPPKLDMITLQYIHCGCLLSLGPASSIDNKEMLPYIVTKAVEYLTGDKTYNEGEASTADEILEVSIQGRLPSSGRRTRIQINRHASMAAASL